MKIINKVLVAMAVFFDSHLKIMSLTKYMVDVER